MYNTHDTLHLQTEIMNRDFSLLLLRYQQGGQSWHRLGLRLSAVAGHCLVMRSGWRKHLQPFSGQQQCKQWS